MTVAVISDIHANLPALRAVLADIDATAPNATIWHTGDIVGYNAHPNEVIELLRERGVIGVMGNHDAAAVGVIDSLDFNPAAAAAIAWTQSVLTPSSREWLENLPRIVELGDATLVHGSPSDPFWEYIDSAERASANAETLKTPLLFHGHTHRPRLFAASDPAGPVHAISINVAPISLSKHALINVGSVGQPRDGDPRACWVLWEHTDVEGSRLGSAMWRRVPYAISETQAAMRAVHLPERLIERLAHGE
jgi:predicted phosphodiesterase